MTDSARLLADLLGDGGVEGEHPHAETQLVLDLEAEFAGQQEEQAAKMRCHD